MRVLGIIFISLFKTIIHWWIGAKIEYNLIRAYIISLRLRYTVTFKDDSQP